MTPSYRQCPRTLTPLICMFVGMEVVGRMIVGEKGSWLTGTIDRPNRFLATMSMSITSHSSSNSFFISAAAAPELRAEKDCDALKSFPLSDTVLNVGRNSSVVTTEFDCGECFGVAGSGTCDDEPGARILSAEEVTRHKREDDAWIVVDGKVYDVTTFLGIHPGGPELILDYLASKDNANDAGPLMRGKADEDAHSHSKAAFHILQQFLLGSVKAPSKLEQPDGSAQVASASNVKKYGYDVDLTKPIVCQVGYLGADYDEWVHDPVISHDTPRFFESNFLEFFTRTKWWVIPLVWIPVAMAMIYTAVVKENVPLSRLPVLTAGGILLWSCLEYLMHRFLFHMTTSSFWGNTLHYVLHGFHHKHPMDGSRLVFPPLFAAPLIVLIWIGLGRWAAEYPNKLVIFAFALISYVVYDITHYFLHFGTPFNAHTRQMKRYHLDHHFKDQTRGFGITSIVWDKVFRTQPPSRKPSLD